MFASQRFLSHIFNVFLTINVLFRWQPKCVQAIVFSQNRPADDIEIRLSPQQQHSQSSHRVLSGGDPTAYYRKQPPPPPLPPTQSIYFESPISYNYPNANDESLQSQPAHLAPLSQTSIVFEDVRRSPANQPQSFAANAYEEDLQTSDLPYHLQQELPQYHPSTKDLQRLKSSTSNENSLFFNQQRSYLLPSLNTAKKTNGIVSIRSPVYIPFASDFGDRRTKTAAAATVAAADASAVEKKKVAASRTNKSKIFVPTKTANEKKINDDEREYTVATGADVVDSRIEIQKIQKLEKTSIDEKPSTFKPSRLPSKVLAFQNDKKAKEKAKPEKEAVKSQEAEPEYEEVAEDADVDDDEHENEHEHDDDDDDNDEKEDDVDEDYELSKPQIASSTQVSIQTSKSVATSLRTATTASIVPTLTPGNLALNMSADNSSDNWMIVASVQTSRSVSGARFLSFPLTIQLANDSAPADEDLTTPMSPRIAAEKATATTTAATATSTVTHASTLTNSIRILDDISKFLPSNYRQPSKNSIFTRSSGDQKQNGTKSNRNDTLTTVPALTEELKTNINAIRPKFIENIEKFLPPNYKKVVNESTTSWTTLARTTALPSTTELAEMASNSSTSSSVKVVFPTRPGNLRPIYRTTTVASSATLATNLNASGAGSITTPRSKPRLKEWPKRQSTQFTGWPTATPETISIEKLLEAAKKQRDQELLELSAAKTAATAATTTSTSAPITREPQATIRTTTPGICAGSCDLDATVKLVGGAKWVPELLNRNTKEWQILANEVQTKLEEAFSRSELLRKWYKKIRIEEFSEGSGVLVDYYVEMNNIADDINTNKIKRMFHDALFSSFDVDDDNGRNGDEDPSLTDQYSAKLNLGSFVIDPKFTDFIVIPKRDNSNLKNLNDEDLLPQWAIAVIVIGLVSLIFVTLFGLSVLINRKKNTKIKQRLPFTEEMIHEYNKNHIMANTFDNYAVDDLYNMEDVWNEKIAFEDGNAGHDDFDPHRHPGHHHHHHHHHHHSHQNPNQDIYGGSRHLTNSSGGRSSNSNGTGSGSRSGSGSGSGSGYLDRNGYGNLFGGSSSSGSNNQSYHNHHHSQLQPQQQQHNHKKQRSSSSSLHDNSLSHLYDSWRSEWNGYYLNAYHNGGGGGGGGGVPAGAPNETGPAASAATLATTNYSHRTLSPVQYYGNGSNSGNGAVSPIGLNIGYVSRRKPDYDTNF